MLVASDERRHAGDQKTPQVLIAHLGDTPIYSGPPARRAPAGMCQNKPAG